MRSSKDSKLNVGSMPHAAFRNFKGFTHTALLAAIVIIGISLGPATKYWQIISLRDNEEELIFRGDQYHRAIESYSFSIPVRMRYPQSMDELLKDGRTAQGKRYLRQKLIRVLVMGNCWVKGSSVNRKREDRGQHKISHSVIQI